MADSTPPLPPVPPVTAPLPPARGDVKTIVLDTTGDLQQVARPTRIDGTAARMNGDGSVTIATDQGEITVTLRAPLPPNQPVQLDIPPGNPPRVAILRLLDAPLSAPQSQPPVSAAPPDMPSGARMDLLPPRPLPLEAPLPAQSSSFPLEQGQPVRLLPLPPGAPVLPAPPNQQGETIQSALPGRIAPPGTLSQQTGTLSLPSASLTASPFQTPPLLQFLSLASPFASVLSTNQSPGGNLPVTIAAIIPGQGSPSAFQGLPSAASLTLHPLSSLALPDKPGAALPQASAGMAPSSKIDIRVQSVIPAPLRMSGAPTPVMPATLFAGQSAATVEGFSSGGLPVLSITLSGNAWPESFVLQFPASNLTPGARLTFMPQPGMVQPAATPVPLSAGLPDSLGIEWPALQELSATLQQAAPQALQTLSHMLPNPSLPSQLPAAALLLLAAARSGDVDSWLGDKTIDVVKRSGKPDLLSRLSGDLRAANRASSDPVVQDWKALPMPLYYEGQLQKAMLWFRQDGGSGDSERQDNKRSTRFIFDLNLTRMGAVQLDGLAKGQRIDLIVRTLHFISPVMRQAMRQQFTRILEQASFAGELSFQDTEAQFIKIGAAHAARAYTI